MTLIFNPKNNGLAKVFRDYQEEAMKYVWKRTNEGTISREVWENVNDRLRDKTISRASIINFLNSMVDEGALSYEERTGKGGFHGVYRPMHCESEFKVFMATMVISSLMRDFPEETRIAVKECL